MTGRLRRGSRRRLFALLASAVVLAGVTGLGAGVQPVHAIVCSLCAGTPETPSTVEGGPYGGEVGTFTDDNNSDSYTATVTWPDASMSDADVSAPSGTGPYTYTITLMSFPKTFSEDGSRAYTIAITDVNDSDTTQDTGTLSVDEELIGSNHSPPISIPEHSQFSGQLVTFTDPGSPDPATSFTTSIHWGDDTASSGQVTGSAGSYAISGTHTWADEMSGTIVVDFQEVHTNASFSVHIPVTVTENDSLTDNGTIPVSATENQAFTLPLGNFTDTDTATGAADFSGLVDWGDGVTNHPAIITGSAGSFTVSGSHTYADEGTYTIHVHDLNDDSPSALTPLTFDTSATVGEADQLTPHGTTISQTENIAGPTDPVASFTDSYDNVASDFTATIDWGDGITTAAAVIHSAAHTFKVAPVIVGHTYADEGSYPITVTLTDNTPGGTAVATAHSTAIIADADSFTGKMAHGVTVNEGSSTGTVNVLDFTDTGTTSASDLDATIDWGDGGGPQAATVVHVSAHAFKVQGSHTYADENTSGYPLSVTVTDAGGAPTTVATQTAIVNEADALVFGGGPVSGLNERQPSGPVVVATFTDAAYPAQIPGDFTATIAWGDGTAPTAGSITESSGTFSVTGSHTYADEATPAHATVTVTDDAVGTTPQVDHVDITVNDTDALALTGNPNPISATEGVTWTNPIATFADADTTAPASDFAATVHWGDGSSSPGTVSGSNGNYSVSASHLYTDEGVFNATVDIADDGTGNASLPTVSTTFNVAENDPLAASSSPISTAEEHSFTGPVATFTDSNVHTLVTDFSTHIDWGDGTSSSGSVTGAAGSFTVNGTHTYVTEGSYSVAVTVTDDAPGTSTVSVTSPATVAETNAADAETLTPKPLTVNPTEAASFTGTVATFTNTDTAVPAADLTAHIDWGDGAAGAGTVSPGGQAGTYQVAGTHTYADEGTFPVKVTLTDPVSGASSPTATAGSTANVAEADVLTTTATTNLVGKDGSPVSGVVATVTDSNPAATAGDLVATINWGDGSSSPGTVTGSGSPFSVNGTHTYTGEGNFTTVVTVADDNTAASDAGSASSSATGSIQVLAATVATALTGEPQGYWLVASDGGIFPFGTAPGLGSTGNIRLNEPIVGMAETLDGAGYWLVAGDGGIFPFGNAQGFGSTGGTRLNKPIVGMAATPDGGGYWLVGSDGGVFPFGDAGGFGSTGNRVLNKPIVGIVPTADGRGYWLVASDGGIFPFGDALGFGSTGAMRLNKPIVGMAATPDGGGYWLVASDGGIFPFGDAGGFGSTGNLRLNQPIVGMAGTPDGQGYWLVAADGGIFPFGDAQGLGSTGNIRLNQPIVGMAGLP